MQTRFGFGVILPSVLICERFCWENVAWRWTIRCCTHLCLDSTAEPGTTSPLSRFRSQLRLKRYKTSCVGLRYHPESCAWIMLLQEYFNKKENFDDMICFLLIYLSLSRSKCVRLTVFCGTKKEKFTRMLTLHFYIMKVTGDQGQ